MLELTECPRDAMQGISGFIPTETKAEYLNLLLRVGFTRLDFGSFVSPRAIPQMQDTAEVIPRLNMSGTSTQLLAIVANKRGAEEASEHEIISVLGFPFSLSETFQIRNTNASREEALKRTEEIVEICLDRGKIPLVYLSMGFGNPYGDPWSPEIAVKYTGLLRDMGVQEIRIADTTGLSDAETIQRLFPLLGEAFPDLSLGVHLHSDPAGSYSKSEAAYQAGCRKFDSALRGFGGCPMARDELVGNISTETMFALARDKTAADGLNYDWDAWEEALLYSSRIFG